MLEEFFGKKITNYSKPALNRSIKFYFEDGSEAVMAYQGIESSEIFLDRIEIIGESEEIFNSKIEDIKIKVQNSMIEYSIEIDSNNTLELNEIRIINKAFITFENKTKLVLHWIGWGENPLASVTLVQIKKPSMIRKFLNKFSSFI